MVGWRTRLSLAAAYLTQRRADDSFIVAHPRSGSTWLRTIITNILVPDAQSNPDVFNTLIPGISHRNMRQVSQLPSPRILTSHTMYLPGLPRVLYLVRDGRDVLVSYYNYSEFRKSRLGQSTEDSADPIDFATFYDRYYRGAYGHIWHEHVVSWLDKGRFRDSNQFLLVRFEDLRANTEDTVMRITQFLGIRTDRYQVAQAIDEANIDNVRRLEKLRWQQKGFGIPDSKTTFYGVGGRRSINDYFSAEMLKEFSVRSEKALRLAGYDRG